MDKAGYNHHMESLKLAWYRALTRFAFWLTRQPAPIKNGLIWLCLKLYDVHLHEAVRENPEDYATFNDFFTRALKAQVRPVATTDLVSPVDGRVSQFGAVHHHSLIQAKGKTFSTQTLLGPGQWTNTDFQAFTTIYLSPRDYHRIHMPRAGQLLGMTYIPGDLWSVSPETVATVDQIYARNERLVCYFTSDQRVFVVVLVGATNVAAMEVVWEQGLIQSQDGQPRHYDYQDQSIQLVKGEELGRFNMGSTVILLFPQQVVWEPDFRVEAPVKMGQAMAELERMT